MFVWFKNDNCHPDPDFDGLKCRILTQLPPVSSKMILRITADVIAISQTKYGSHF
ncbi:3143_t:CDS:2 [Entrophospora sp. SA101]|nr:3143_t:CDS:2 [Entrophospora sp. SA101]